MAIEDIYKTHKYVATAEEAATAALAAGCDLNCCIDKCEEARLAAKKALLSGMISRETIDESLRRLFMTRMKLGMFDPDSKVRYSRIPPSVVDCVKHREFCAEVSRSSLVLLKNNGILPLNPAKAGTIALIGPNCDDVEVLLGNYNGTPSCPVTPLSAFRNSGVKTAYSRGCGITGDSRAGFKAAIETAEGSDVIVFCGGLSPKIEGEECDTGGYERADLGLPGMQEELIRELKKSGKPLILVLISGSALSIDPGICDAIVQAWYPGQSGGEAIADLVFGKFCPSGRLPVTVYKSVKDLPDFREYSMANRTYRYFKGEPLYPFGYGLSYTTFRYSSITASKAAVEPGCPVTVSAEVKNTGKMAGHEVVQLYIRDVEASCAVPQKSLAGFKRVFLEPGEKKKVKFEIQPSQLALVNEKGERIIEKGEFEAAIGGIQPGFECETTNCVKTVFYVL